jgi:3-deoxy-manno-octulosonate cytidylyltransferase (CMP-KDO synthetase)
VLDFVVRPASALESFTAVAIIPARLQSTRLPGKPLLDLCGVPMIVRVYERVRATPGLADVLVATDDLRVKAAVDAHGGRCVMTRADHPTGTDRLAEVAATLACDVVVNVQGDEPLIEPAMIADLLAPFAANPALEMSTLCRPFEHEDEFKNPNIVKAVVGRDGFALYFSRAPVPFHRATGNTGAPTSAFRHIGIYAYRRATLLRLAALRPTPLETLESLEQLRALEHGIRIHVAETRFDSIGVDTEADVARVRAILSSAAPAPVSAAPLNPAASAPGR